MCVACQTYRPKRELVRVVLSQQGEVEFDATGKRPGRGAYLCPNEICLEQAFRKKRLERALGKPVPEETIDRLRAYLSGAAKEVRE